MILIAVIMKSYILSAFIYLHIIRFQKASYFLLPLYAFFFLTKFQLISNQVYDSFFQKPLKKRSLHTDRRIVN